MSKEDGHTFKVQKKVTLLTSIFLSSVHGYDPDYKQLANMPKLPPSEQRIVKQALLSLQPRINAAKEQEMGEMMGKLKEVCFLGALCMFASQLTPS